MGLIRAKLVSNKLYFNVYDLTAAKYVRFQNRNMARVIGRRRRIRRLLIDSGPAGNRRKLGGGRGESGLDLRPYGIYSRPAYIEILDFASKFGRWLSF